MRQWCFWYSVEDKAIKWSNICALSNILPTQKSFYFVYSCYVIFITINLWKNAFIICSHLASGKIYVFYEPNDFQSSIKCLIQNEFSHIQRTFILSWKFYYIYAEAFDFYSKWVTSTIHHFDIWCRPNFCLCKCINDEKGCNAKFNA